MKIIIFPVLIKYGGEIVSVVTQKSKNIFITLVMLASLFLATHSLVDPVQVAEAGSKVFEGVNVGGDNGTVTTSNSASTGIFSGMNALLIVVMGIAGFACIGALIFAGTKLAYAQGNPQARTQGFIGLGVSALGIWVVYKCLVIAGWVGGFGG